MVCDLCGIQRFPGITHSCNGTTSVFGNGPATNYERAELHESLANELGRGYGAIQQQLADLRKVVQFESSASDRFLALHRLIDSVSLRSAAIEEKLDAAGERLDEIVKYAENGKQMRVETVDKLDDIEEKVDALARIIARRRFGRRPAKKKRGRNDR